MNEEEKNKDAPWEDEANYEETDITVNDEEKLPTQEENQELDVNKSKNDSVKFFIGFVIRSVTAIFLSILALKFILPSNSSDVFYKLYFVLFIVFELGVFICYVFANRSIFMLQFFFKSITDNKGRYSSLNSKKKKVNDVY